LKHKIVIKDAAWFKTFFECPHFLIGFDLPYRFTFTLIFPHFSGHELVTVIEKKVTKMNDIKRLVEKRFQLTDELK